MKRKFEKFRKSPSFLFCSVLWVVREIFSKMPPAALAKIFLPRGGKQRAGKPFFKVLLAESGQKPPLQSLC